MATQDPERLFDVRTVHRHIREGRITEEAYRAHLEALPDVSDKMRPPDDLPLEGARPAAEPPVEAPAAPSAAAPAGADFAAGWDIPDDIAPPSPAAPSDVDTGPDHG